MAYWQAQADMPGGGKILFGIQAESTEIAMAGVLALLDGAGTGVQVTLIPDPLSRIGLA
jgi:hypothetical protein